LVKLSAGWRGVGGLRIIQLVKVVIILFVPSIAAVIRISGILLPTIACLSSDAIDKVLAAFFIFARLRAFGERVHYAKVDRDIANNHVFALNAFF